MSLTLIDFTTRFPKYTTMTQGQFDMYQGDAVIEMGVTVARWLNQSLYDIAQAYLMAHLATVAQLQAAGDSAPMAPLRQTDVDGVKIEYAIAKEGLATSPDWLATTSYGQQYIRYRRMAFAGPRIA